MGPSAMLFVIGSGVLLSADPDRLWRSLLKSGGPRALTNEPKTNTKPCGTVTFYGAAVTDWQTCRNERSDPVSPGPRNGLMIHCRERSSGGLSLSWRFQKINTGRLHRFSKLSRGRESCLASRLTTIEIVQDPCACKPLLNVRAGLEAGEEAGGGGATRSLGSTAMQPYSALP